MTRSEARFYRDLASWWPLFSPPIHYDEEAADLLARLAPTPAGSSLLELGSGGGSLAWHLKRHFKLTLTDLSPGMSAVNRAVNPEAEHAVGDMRALRLEREFDVVLIHDAIMYATTADDVRASLRTAATHCRPGGTVVVLPDYVTETFEPNSEHGGEDGEDGKGFRYLAWCWDPNPDDETYLVDYAFMMREVDGSVSVEHDRHLEGLFPRDQWLAWFAEAGIPATSSRDPWNREVFMGRKPGPRLSDRTSTTA